MRYLIQHWLGLSVKFGQSFGFVLACVLTQLAVAQGIEEVTIQAEIQEDSALDDLVSVSSLSAEKLADAGIENVEDVAAYVPNLVLTQTETGTSIVIRGIGAGANQGFDQSVGLYIDGVPLPRANMARAPFLDLSSVQVLRGPQYVLDGNYSIAGSVHMLSDLSVDEFKSAVDFNYVPSQNAQSLLLTVGGPINDTFAARVAIQAKRSDGYVENVTRNEGNESDDLVARLVLGFFPTDDLSFKLKFEKGIFKTLGRANEIILDMPTPTLNVTRMVNGSLIERRPGAVKVSEIFLVEEDYIHTALKTRYNTRDAFSGTIESATSQFLFSGKSYLQRLAEIYTNPVADPFNANPPAATPAPIPKGLLDDGFNFKRGADAEEIGKNESENFTLNVEYWLGEHNIKSTSSYITYEFNETIDGDFTAASLVELEQAESYEQLFQRFDYTSPEGYFLEFKGGVSYLHSNLKFNDVTRLQLTERPAHLHTGTNRPVADLTFYPDEPLRQYLGSAGFEYNLLAIETYRPERAFSQTSDITAAYFQTTLHWRDNLRTRLGLRYTHSDKTAARDLAILDENGNKPVPQLTGDRIMDTTTLQGMYSLYLKIFGIQVHSGPDSGPDAVTVRDENGILTNAGPGLRGNRRDEALLPSITLEWDISDDFSTFLSARMANKTGGFDARSNTRPDIIPGAGGPVGTFEFKDEDALTYELGTKWYLPGGFGEVTAVAFYTDYKNLQVSRFDGRTGFNVDNAGAANSKGIEIEGLLQVTDSFSMQYSLAWIDFTFTDFIFGACHLGERPDHYISNIVLGSGLSVVDSNGNPAVSGQPIPIRYEEVNRTFNNPNKPWEGSLENPNFIDDFDTTRLSSPAFCDFNGRTNQFVAERQATFAFNYETEIKNLGVFKPTLDVLYNSGYFASVSQDPLAAQDEYFQFNGRLALVSFEDTWTVALTGENLTNQKIISYANDTPIGARLQGARGFAAFVRPPRTIGLNLRYKFY